MALRYYLEQTVYDAALERIRWIFQEFPNVVVGFSGGKDSTVIFHLSLKVAAELGRLPLSVLFIDQEAEWQCTVDFMRETMTRDDVRPFWLQVPIKLFNATSAEDEWLITWEPGREDVWMRPKEPYAIKENVYGTDRFADLFNAFFRHHFPGERACLIGGVRTEESPSRMVGLTHEPKYKWVTWAKRLTAGLHYTFYPIYDWGWTDVWKTIHDNGWRYNRLYDLQYCFGTPIPEMRVSNVHHETAVKSLFILQEFEPETYARLTQRIGGIDTAGKMGADDFFVRKLPFMFSSWLEYRDFLLERIIAEDKRDKFRRHFARQERYYGDNYGDKLFRAQIQSLLTNDFHCTKLKNFDNRPDSVALRKRLKAIKAEEADA